jgi:hypothetical protein
LGAVFSFLSKLDGQAAFVSTFFAKESRFRELRNLPLIAFLKIPFSKFSGSSAGSLDRLRKYQHATFVIQNEKKISYYLVSLL